jgi:hypothetical protein
MERLKLPRKTKVRTLATSKMAALMGGAVGPHAIKRGVKRKSSIRSHCHLETAETECRAVAVRSIFSSVRQMDDGPVQSLQRLQHWTVLLTE